MGENNVVNIFDYKLAKAIVDDLPEVIEALEKCRDVIGRDEYLKYKSVVEVLGNIHNAIFDLDGQFEHYYEVARKFREDQGLKLEE